MVEEEESSDDNDGGDMVRVQTPPPALEGSDEDDDMGQNASDNEDAHASGDDGDEDEEEELVRLPEAFPTHPPAPYLGPDLEYPPPETPSSSGDRNRLWARKVRNSFVAYQPGMKGDPYKKRCAYEHMQVMG